MTKATDKCLGIDCFACPNPECPNEKKSIIIDDVDVSECKELQIVDKEPYCDSSDTAKLTCKGNDCYYKQLQRLQAKNEELKKNIEALENKLQLRMASDKESNEFWDSVFNEEYPFNKENAYKELSDYYFVLEQLPSIYLEITGGRLSKTTYFASSVIEAYNNAIQEYWDKIDDFETAINEYKNALEEIRVIATKDVSIESCAKIQIKINEVLNDVDI